jgi:hypothetical protein
MAMTEHLVVPHAREQCDRSFDEQSGSPQSCRSPRAAWGRLLAAYFSSLNAWVHWFRRNPGMHHNIHKGSIARADST